MCPRTLHRDQMGTARDERTSGWSIESRTDEIGRTLYSIFIGDRLVVQDALDSDAAVIAARKWIQSRQAAARDANPRSGVALGNGASH